MNDVVTIIQEMSSRDFALLIGLVFLLIIELAIHKNATRKPPLI